ncbi:MAG: extracellular solute-binding protein [Defluviitaleaceae bacterium]|nr:extracellular solute-binding protein [Defluviitaleaceae bacterium]
MKKNAVHGIVKTFMLLVMILGLAACGTAAQPEPPAQPVDATVTQAQEQEPPAGGERVNITYAMWGDASEVEQVRQVIQQFESEQDWISVEVINIDRGDFEATLNTMAIAGNLPDTAIMAEPMVLNWAERGMLLPAGDMFAGFPEEPLEKLGFRWDGETVGYSVANELLLNFFNRDMFEAADVDVPPANVADAWSWDEFIDTARTMTLDTNGNNAHSPNFDPSNIVQYGVMFDPAIWMLEVWALANGGGWYDPADPFNVIIDQPAAVESLQMIADLHLVHNVSPQFGTNIAATIETYLLENAAMYINGQWSVGVWLGPAQFSDGLNYGVGVLPSMQRNITMATGGVNVAFSTSQHQEAAREWLAWYAQVENSWAMIESGIWMPIFPIWYHDEAYMRRWAENPNFPPFEEYRSAVINYALTNAVPTSWYWVNNTELFNDVLSTALAPVWSGHSTAEEAINGAIGALRAANRGN